MVYTLLTLDDFSGMEFTSNMKCMDYLLLVSETSYLKSMYREEDNLIAEQDKEFRIKKEEKITQNIRSILSSFPHVLDQDKSVLGLVVPKGRRSMPKKRRRRVVTERFLCDGGDESMIKKAVENKYEDYEEAKPIKLDWSVIAAKFVRPIGVTVNNQELLESRVKAADNRENRGIKNNYRGSTNFGKRSLEVANGDFSNQEAARQKKRNIIARVVPVAPPVVMINRELSIEFKNLITFNGGLLESAKLVIEKRLFETDVKPAEGRFSIPQNQMSNNFLKPDEEELLNRRNEANKMCEMNVMLIEPSHRVGEINLRKWTMNKNNGKASSSYVLVKHWNDVTRRNRLKSGMKMQLWAFRKDEELCFALVNV
ncbi:putative B3 domain-containing protein At5g35780 [Solanum dulcamara]|uniref:putative B3 domain-containing protein At5g35780 n=1 Tax=Solanum dulcamara TaxID=45834 RepID=UPI0024863710|nr:putative B3 domain-containing protein At5g35780 [Solanum dulcamara]